MFRWDSRGSPPFKSVLCRHPSFPRGRISHPQRADGEPLKVLVGESFLGVNSPKTSKYLGEKELGLVWEPPPQKKPNKPEEKW